ncbi:hypothetical protein HPULCUR_004948 [Helicostylum pulchrum]|uniref:Uncharacterized protein n=1 Tax=Helicostylum pulchrum TaxID=562976 RepID=A0ABP9XXQ0_9FUNG
MVENFKLEFLARHSTRAAGSAVDPVYDKLEELLKRYPTILPPYTRRREATLSADTQALINRMDREHELRRGEFRELREYLQRQGDINNSAVNTLLGSIERISTVVERYEARMREIHDRLNQRLN